MRLRYTPRALSELDAILRYIGERSPRGAARVKARLASLARTAAEHPDGGRPTANPRLRRMVATPYPYLLFYEVQGDDVVVIAVRHGARDPASMPGGSR